MKLSNYYSFIPPREEAPRARPKGASLLLAREIQQKRRQATHLLGTGATELYTDKDRAAAVTMGDQDIKTSLKVSQNCIGRQPSLWETRISRLLSR